MPSLPFSRLRGQKRRLQRRPIDGGLIGQLQSGHLTKDQYLDIRADQAVRHLVGKIPDEKIGIIRETLREQLTTDPLLMAMVRPRNDRSRRSMNKGLGSRERHYVVSDQPSRLPIIIEALAPGDFNALNDGRVFVDGRRADASIQIVQPGSRVTWYAPRTVKSIADDIEFRTLDRRDNFVIVAKPAYWTSEPDRSGHGESLRERASRHFNVSNLHVATRLDAGVSGLVLIAIGETARRDCSRLQRTRQIRKEYLAIALGAVAEHTCWDAPLDGARSARTAGHRLAESSPIRFTRERVAPVSLLHIDAVTGRHHQIRVHASVYGHPLLGDRRYGGPTQWVGRATARYDPFHAPCYMLTD